MLIHIRGHGLDLDLSKRMIWQSNLSVFTVQKGRIQL